MNYSIYYSKHRIGSSDSRITDSFYPIRPKSDPIRSDPCTSLPVGPVLHSVSSNIMGTLHKLTDLLRRNTGNKYNADSLVIDLLLFLVVKWNFKITGHRSPLVVYLWRMKTKCCSTCWHFLLYLSTPKPKQEINQEINIMVGSPQWRSRSRQGRIE